MNNELWMILFAVLVAIEITIALNYDLGDFTMTLWILVFIFSLGGLLYFLVGATP